METRSIICLFTALPKRNKVQSDIEENYLTNKIQLQLSCLKTTYRRERNTLVAIQVCNKKWYGVCNEDQLLVSTNLQKPLFKAAYKIILLATILKSTDKDRNIVSTIVKCKLSLESTINSI